MNKLRILLLYILSVFFNSSYASTPESPSFVAQQYLDAISSRNILKSADYIRSADLIMFKKTLLPIYDMGNKEGERDLIYGGFENSEMVSKANDKEFYSIFIKSALNIVGGAGVPIGEMSSKVLGVVHETPELSHVVIRSKVTVSNFSIENLEILSLEKKEGKWFIILPEKLKKMMQLVKQMRSKKTNNFFKPYITP